MSGNNIRAAVENCFDVRWMGIRNEASYRSSLKSVVEFLETRCDCLDAITTAHIAALVRHLQACGNAPRTIRHKVGLLGAVFETAIVADPPLASKPMPKRTVRVPRTLKWWLTPDDQRLLTGWLRARRGKHDLIVADYIDFVCVTGLRVEEALRLEGSMFSGLGSERPNMLVPGEKTAGAQKTLPLFPAAAAIAERLIDKQTNKRARLFPLSYRQLQRKWLECRHHLDLEDNPSATLKALRRSFGRHATEQGMPTELLRDYYRHTDLKTTAGYLSLVGGYDTETMRQWVPKGPTHSTPCGSSSSRSSQTEAYA